MQTAIWFANDTSAKKRTTCLSLLITPADQSADRACNSSIGVSSTQDSSNAHRCSHDIEKNLY